MSRERACNDIQKRLALYQYGELSPGEYSEVEAHLSGCGQCMRELDAIKGVLEAVPGSVPNSGEVRDAVMGTMHAIRHLERKRWSRRLIPAYVAAAAAAAAIVLSIYVPDILQKSPRQNQVIAQADWEMLENFDIAKDYNTIEDLDDFENLDEHAPPKPENAKHQEAQKQHLGSTTASRDSSTADEI